MCFCATQVHSQILASDIPETLRVPSHTLVNKQAARLYTIMYVLSRSSSLFGLPLQDWVNLVHGLDSDVSEKQQAEVLYLKALSVGSRYALDKVGMFMHLLQCIHTQGLVGTCTIHAAFRIIIPKRYVVVIFQYSFQVGSYFNSDLHQSI